MDLREVISLLREIINFHFERTYFDILLANVGREKSFVRKKTFVRHTNFMVKFTFLRKKD